MHVQKIQWIMWWIVEDSGTGLGRVDRHVRGCKTWSQGCASVYLLHIILAPARPTPWGNNHCCAWSGLIESAQEIRHKTVAGFEIGQIMAKTPGLVGRVEFRATSILCLRVNSFLWLKGVPSSRIHGKFFYIFCGTQISADKGNELAGRYWKILVELELYKGGSGCPVLSLWSKFTDCDSSHFQQTTILNDDLGAFHFSCNISRIVNCKQTFTAYTLKQLHMIGRGA